MHSKGGRARGRDVLLRSAEIAGLDIVISHLWSVRIMSITGIVSALTPWRATALDDLAL